MRRWIVIAALGALSCAALTSTASCGSQQSAEGARGDAAGGRGRWERATRPREGATPRPTTRPRVTTRPSSGLRRRRTTGRAPPTPGARAAGGGGDGACVAATGCPSTYHCGRYVDPCTGNAFVCGSPCTGGQVCASGGGDSQVCQPKSCVNRCGIVAIDGCGVPISCGGCPANQACINNTCVPQTSIDAGAGTCAPLTCTPDTTRTCAAPWATRAATRWPAPARAASSASPASAARRRPSAATPTPASSAATSRTPAAAATSSARAARAARTASAGHVHRPVRPRPAARPRAAPPRTPAARRSAAAPACGANQVCTAGACCTPRRARRRSTRARSPAAAPVDLGCGVHQAVHGLRRRRGVHGQRLRALRARRPASDYGDARLRPRRSAAASAQTLDCCAAGTTCMGHLLPAGQTNINGIAARRQDERQRHLLPVRRRSTTAALLHAQLRPPAAAGRAGELRRDHLLRRAETSGTLPACGCEASLPGSLRPIALSSPLPRSAGLSCAATDSQGGARSLHARHGRRQRGLRGAAGRRVPHGRAAARRGRPARRRDGLRPQVVPARGLGRLRAVPLARARPAVAAHRRALGRARGGGEGVRGDRRRLRRHGRAPAALRADGGALPGRRAAQQERRGAPLRARLQARRQEGLRDGQGAGSRRRGALPRTWRRPRPLRRRLRRRACRRRPSLRRRRRRPWPPRRLLRRATRCAPACRSSCASAT